MVWGERVLARLTLTGQERVVDAGCGTGRLSAALLERLPHGRLLCVDRSANMVRQAAAHLRPLAAHTKCRLHLAHADLLALPLREWADVVFSTATFHWVLDHPALFAQVFTALAPGGRLLAQCGGAGNLARVHRWADEVTRWPAFAPSFEGWADPWEFATPERTRARLAEAGFVDVTADLEEAPTPFETRATFEAFMRTVVLRPHLARIAGERLAADFVTAVADEAWAEGRGFWLDYWRLNLSARRPPGEAAAGRRPASA